MVALQASCLADRALRLLAQGMAVRVVCNAPLVSFGAVVFRPHLEHPGYVYEERCDCVVPQKRRNYLPVAYVRQHIAHMAVLGNMSVDVEARGAKRGPAALGGCAELEAAAPHLRARA